MAEWPWLMIILALISTVQWPNSVAQHTNDYKSYWEGYVWFPRKYYHRSERSLKNRDSTTPDPSNVENQRIEPRIHIKNSNVRPFSLTINQTKSSIKNEYLTNISHIQPILNPIPQTRPSSVIIFPNSIDERIEPMDKLIPETHEIEKCSKNESFCAKVDTYPRQDLMRIFRTSKFMSSSFFGVDSINDLETRINSNANNLQPLCDSLEEVIFPEAALNKNNEWRYIVQDPNNEKNSNYKQGIRVEKCLNAGTSCKFDEHMPGGYSTTCVQKYLYKKLVAIKDSNEVYYESFKLPSCCICMYKYENLDQMTRMGGEIENRKFVQSHSEPKKSKEIFNPKI